MDIFNQIETILANTTDTNTAVHELMAMMLVQDFVLLLILIVLAYVIFRKRI